MDDVINPSGHRIGTAEIEAALVTVTGVSEAACIGVPHKIKGDGIGCFICLKDDAVSSEELNQKLIAAVSKSLGAFAKPEFFVYSDLPKTRSGKIMRKLLRQIASGERKEFGDISSLSDPAIVPLLVDNFARTRRFDH
jgi:acetyl-CoA synthetase